MQPRHPTYSIGWCSCAMQDGRLRPTNTGTMLMPSWHFRPWRRGVVVVCQLVGAPFTHSNAPRVTAAKLLPASEAKTTGSTCRQTNSKYKSIAYCKPHVHSKDKTLKSPESYFLTAARKGLRVNESVTSPSKRSTLRILSQERVLMNKDVTLDLSQSLGRNALRDDGLVGALACGCQRMFAPYFGKSLSIQQCMVLQGMDPSAYEISAVSETEMFRLVGNAMCVPVVGTIMAAGTCLLYTSPSPRD